MTTRFPKVCLRCGSLSHYSEDCTRMPANMGKSQQERDLDAMIRRDNRVILSAVALFVLALVLFGMLERVPA